MTTLTVTLALTAPASQAEGSGAAGAATPPAGSRAQELVLRVSAPDCPPNTKPVPHGCIPRTAAHVRHGERCPDARRAVPFYRSLTWVRQRAREGELADRTPIVRGKTCRWVRYAAREWQARAQAALETLRRWRRERARIPRGEAQIRAHVNDDCLEEIIDRETAGTWSPTIWNGAGSGAYGLPQALPGHKMASAGPDWRTNPKTQVRWMRGYVNGRYGGSCAALAFHNANGWY